jgi:ASC-1-like (ASCH) protein
METLLISLIIYGMYLFTIILFVYLVDDKGIVESITRKTRIKKHKKENVTGDRILDSEIIMNVMDDMIDKIDKYENMENIHMMNLDSNWFLHVKSGKKNIECRVYDDKRKQLNIGDKIIFKNNSSEDEVEKNIKKLQLFSDFETALKCGKLKNILPGVKSYRDGLNIYNEIPGYVDKSKDNGVLLIYLE